MAEPPAYHDVTEKTDYSKSNQHQNSSAHHQSPTYDTNPPVPPYRASHGFANPAEELAALREFAESKLYVEQGTEGTLGGVRGSITGMVGRNGEVDRQYGEQRKEWAETRKRNKEEKRKGSVGTAGLGDGVEGGAESGEGIGIGKKGKERKGSVSERLKKVFSGGDSASSGLGGDGGKDVVR